MNHTISYARRSRDVNADSVSKQHRENEDYAKKHNLTIYDKLDDNISGYEALTQHRELVRVLDLCLEKGIKDIVVTNMSRLTRSLRDGILLLDWMHRNGIRLHFSKKGKVYTDVDYLDLARELADVEEYYWKFAQGDKALGEDSVYGRGRPPNGYTSNKSKPGTLVKSADAVEVEAVFDQANQLHSEKQHKQLSKIAAEVKSKKYGRPAIRRMLSNPIYTGRKAPRGTKDIKDLRQYPRVHAVYVSDEDFIRLNGGKVIRHLEYSKVVVCEACSQKAKKAGGKDVFQHHLFLNGPNLKCQGCSSNISIRKLEKMIQEMCREYIFNPDSSAEFKFEHLSTISQLEKIFENIANQGKGGKGTGVYVANAPGMDAGTLATTQAEVWKQWEKLKRQIKKRLNMGHDDIALHFACAQRSENKGKEIRDLLERCFGGVYVRFGQRGSPTLRPIKLARDVKKTQNRVGDEQFAQDLLTLEKNIGERMQLLRSILEKNPFLMDYLAWNTVDRTFKQWDSFFSYVRKRLLYDPYI